MNLIEISEKFQSELDCIEYAEKIKYGNKPKCVYCGSENLGKRMPDFRHRCKNCNKSTSVTVNTAIQGTRVPLKTWFYAISVITDAKKGLSALQLQRNLSVSYPTAFSMYHKLRELMAQENQETDELSGIVEMDEKYIGGKPRNLNTPYINADNVVDLVKQKKKEELDQQIKDLNKQGFDFTPQGKNRSKIKLENKRGRGTDNIPVVGLV